MDLHGLTLWEAHSRKMCGKVDSFLQSSLCTEIGDTYCFKGGLKETISLTIVAAAHINAAIMQIIF